MLRNKFLSFRKMSDGGFEAVDIGFVIVPVVVVAVVVVVIAVV